MIEKNEVREAVRQRYAAAATAGSGCCGETSCGAEDPIIKDLYPSEELVGLPEDAVAASLGCGNPTALAELRPGEVVLDLGSGGGIDVLLSARRVGPQGKAYGLDMTDEMLELARRNQKEAGVTNVEFLKGYMEDIPLPDNSVDIIISNCVINLAADKDSVFKEALRVLRPGGRFAVSDVIFQGEMPEEIRRSIELWSGCIAGALEESEYREKLAGAGFVDIDLELVRVYDNEELCAMGGDADTPDIARAAAGGGFASAFVRARKP